MTIRKKILLFSALALGFFLAAVYLVSRWALLSGFARLESDSSRQNIERIQQALENEGARLDIFARDYAQWDETYEFMQAQSPAYVRSELANETFRILHIDLFALLDERGHLVFSKNLAREPLTPEAMQTVLRMTEGSVELGRGHSGHGFVELNGQMMLLSFHPILPSAGIGVSRGTLVMGQELNEELLSSLSHSAGIALWVEPADRIVPTSPQGLAWTDGHNCARFETDSTMLEYVAVPDFSGKTRRFLAARVPRSLHRQGQTEVRYLWGLLMLAGTVFCGVLFFFMEEVLVRKIARLDADISKITVSGDLSTRLNAEGKDELSNLARTVNTMLSGIQKAKAELLEAQESLRFHAEHDALTGVLNRRAIRDVLRKELARCRRERTTLGVILADVDHFKKINDHYGHAAGDAVLVTTVQRISATLRTYDTLGRYGGEEFLIIAPGCDLALAEKMAERIRNAVSDEPVDLGDESARISMSLGVTLGTWESDPEFLVEQADSAMYQAKRKGRNRVEIQADTAEAGKARF
ncbi:MAG TPA: diguanylate cyclase, partial [Terriglobales bacterium]|nr:diguanylate cyclase [Terriglobales bacterium]